MNHETWIYLQHDFRRVCVLIALNAALANVLPRHELLRRHPLLHAVYRLFVDCVAAFGLNIRVSLPSLDVEFLGCRRQIRHGYRNWRQDRIDRKVEQQ